MSLTPEELYLRLGSLVAEMPDLASGPITPETNLWLGRAATLVEATGDIAGLLTMTNAAQWLAGANRDLNAQMIAAVVYTALAKAELAAPAAVQGTFIAAGHTFDAFAAVTKVLSTATTDLLMIDPYADEKLLRRYAVSAPERVSVRILADQAYCYKQSLRPAAEQWMQQFGSTRPLSVRLATPKTLHDRSILVDRATAWTVGQSFKDLAARSYTTLVRQQDPEAAALMIAAFETMWNTATPL
jgi:hypothetical protein